MKSVLTLFFLLFLLWLSVSTDASAQNFFTRGLKRPRLPLLKLLAIFSAAFVSASYAQGVVSVSPVQNALNVPRNANIVVTFNEAMDTTTFADSTIRAWGSQSGLHRWGFSYNNTTFALTIDPLIDFSPGEIVTVSLSSRIRIQGGQEV